MGQYGFVGETLSALGSTDRDDVSYELCLAASDEDLRAFAASDAGRRLIDRMFDELTEGSVGSEEQEQADRLMRVKSATISTEAFAAGMQTAKTFPCSSGFTVLDDATIMAERREGGKIWVKYPTRTLGTEMFRAETATLPVDTFIQGIELPENEIIGVPRCTTSGAWSSTDLRCCWCSSPTRRPPPSSARSPRWWGSASR